METMTLATVWHLRVTATDGGPGMLTDTAVVVVAITDVNEPPLPAEEAFAGTALQEVFGGGGSRALPAEGDMTVAERATSLAASATSRCGDLGDARMASRKESPSWLESSSASHILLFEKLKN